MPQTYSHTDTHITLQIYNSSLFGSEGKKTVGKVMNLQLVNLFLYCRSDTNSCVTSTQNGCG